MNLKPLCNLLQNEAVGQQGKDLFMQMMPMVTERGVLLRSPLSGTKINYELDGYFRTTFQLIVRSHDYLDGEALIEQAMQVLTLSNQDVENQSFQFCRPMTLPVAFPLSRGNLVEYTVPFEVCYVETETS